MVGHPNPSACTLEFALRPLGFQGGCRSKGFPHCPAWALGYRGDASPFMAPTLLRDSSATPKLFNPSRERRIVLSLLAGWPRLRLMRRKGLACLHLRVLQFGHREFGRLL